MSEILFFTDITTNASNYCLLNINRYNDERKYKKALIFIDPGVYELKNNIEYPKIHELYYITNRLRHNEYISIDYPNDMNFDYSDIFIEKSVKNNIKYADNERYIAAIQYKFQDFNDFKFRLRELLSITRGVNKIIAFGNLCRIMYPNEYTDKVFNEIKRIVPKGTWLHFYGLSMRLIKRYLVDLSRDYKISVDSTKWTKAINKELKQKYGVNCNSRNRDIFFIEYMKELFKYFDIVHF